MLPDLASPSKGMPGTLFMNRNALDDRTRLAIELALTSGSNDAALIERQDASARRLGFTGAEIDAARQGWSFDVRASAALALAATQENKARTRQREKARQAGLSEVACREIEGLARLLGMPPSRKGPNPV
jgi:hypothetical protein